MTTTPHKPTPGNAKTGNKRNIPHTNGLRPDTQPMTEPGRQTLWVPKQDEWLNANDRLHPQAKARRSKPWREGAAMLARAARLEPYEHRVYIRAFVTKGGRRIERWEATAKAIVDGIVDAGVLVDDSNRWVTGPDMRAATRPGPPGVLIEILPLGENAPDVAYLLELGYSMEQVAALSARTPTAVRYALQN